MTVPFARARFVVDGELLADYARKRGCDPYEVVELFRARQVRLRRYSGPDDAGLGKSVTTVRREAGDTDLGVPLDVHLMDDGSVAVEFHDRDHAIVGIDVDDPVLDALWFLELGDE